MTFYNYIFIGKHKKVRKYDFDARADVRQLNSHKWVRIQV